MIRATLCLGIVMAAVAGSEARADNAFPDEFQVYFPAGHPQRIVLATNFGTITSDDDGATWSLSCEALIDTASSVLFYQVASDGTVFAPFDTTVAHSSDEGCSWVDNTGMAQAVAIPDLFVDPSTPSNVLAIAYLAGSSPSAIFQSSDEGSSFTGPIYTDPDGYLDSLEIARSTPGVAYAAGLIWDISDGGPVPYLLATRDDGAHWTRSEHPELGPFQVAIAEVDPMDSDVVYVRVEGSPPGGDELAIASDGGLSVSVALTLNDTMSSFVRLSDGTLVVGARSGKMWIRPPASRVFTQQAAPHLRCLGEHEGSLFACGDDQMDGFALARSDDLGQTFQPVLSFSQVRQLSACATVEQACAKTLEQLETLFPPPPDAGAADAGPRDAGSASSNPDAGLADGGAPGGPGGGCHCGSEGPELIGFGSFFSLLLARRRRSA